MQYTPGQLRDSVGLSKEAFRHWKRVVPAFAAGKGRGPTFSSGDVLASAVLRQLTDTVGVRIGHLAEIAPAIFRICNVSTWDKLSEKSLIIDLREHTCVLADSPVESIGELVLVCSLAPLIKALERDFLNSPAPSALEDRSSRPEGVRARWRDGQ